MSCVCWGYSTQEASIKRGTHSVFSHSSSWPNLKREVACCSSLASYCCDKDPPTINNLGRKEFTQKHLSWGWHRPQWLGPLLSIITQENAQQVNLMDILSQVRVPLPREPSLGQVDKKQTSREALPSVRQLGVPEFLQSQSGLQNWNVLTLSGPHTLLIHSGCHIQFFIDRESQVLLHGTFPQSVLLLTHLIHFALRHSSPTASGLKHFPFLM